MPKRRATRDDDRARWIERERELNALLLGEGVEAEAEAADTAHEGAEEEAIPPPF